MANYIIGVDPDSKAHGIAVYENGKLITLKCLTLMQVMDLIKSIGSDSSAIEFHIENVCGQNATFSKSFVKNARASTTVSRSLGMCQQAQTELERMIESFGIKIVHHKISKQWKSAITGKASFEGHTCWQGQSNEDTRSAAWFGWIGVTQWHTQNKQK